MQNVNCPSFRDAFVPSEGKFCFVSLLASSITPTLTYLTPYKHLSSTRNLVQYFPGSILPHPVSIKPIFLLAAHMAKLLHISSVSSVVEVKPAQQTLTKLSADVN